ncbi:MAG: hypothetical protein Q9164_000449 [Protoblastenia rupestris]
MASTRRVEIFQDPVTTDSATMPSQHLYNSNTPMFPDENTQSVLPINHDLIFKPPSASASGRSPLKAVRQPSTSPPKANMIRDKIISFPLPEPAIFRTDSPIKKSATSMYPLIALQNPMKTSFMALPNAASADKENAAPSHHSDNVAEFPDPSYGYKPPLKRALSNKGLSYGQSLKKVRLEEPPQQDLPDPRGLPILEDDGNKPQCSYAMLIGMSILRSSERKLTLAQIYKWISDSFSHYRKEDSGWQNSIRHNLSLNKAFIKQERPKDDPGKGNYWAIKPGCECQFIKDKGARRPTSSSGLSQQTSSQQPSNETNAFPHLPAFPKSTPQAKSQAREPSSDATILASDAPSSIDEEVKALPPPALYQPHSSPLQDVCSSPPRGPDRLRNDTPSPGLDFGLPSFSSPESRNSKPVEMDDSGYFSCLDSSARRPYSNPTLPRFDAIGPRIKRGRAEEEIVRIRSSSHDLSPSKIRSLVKQPTPSLVSSSPTRLRDAALMLPPLTPAAGFKFPCKPPASMSPNTNLRNHRNKIRELVGSPAKHPLTFANDDVSYSPAFKIVDEDHYLYGSSLDTGFSIFHDNDGDEYLRAASASPLKRSAWHTDRACKNTNILADITGASLNHKASPLGLQAPSFDSPLKQKSSRSPLSFGSTINDNRKENLFGLNFVEDEEPDDFGGLDILRGFSKIGSNNQVTAPTQRPSRPPLSMRSHTSLF